MCLKYSNLNLNYKKKYIFQICAGGQAGQTVCQGDSGSPLIRFDDKSGWIQEGIVSSGKYDCGEVGSPKVFTSVQSFMLWLQFHMNN